jgi:hypothetical protein
MLSHSGTKRDSNENSKIREHENTKKRRSQLEDVVVCKCLLSEHRHKINNNNNNAMTKTTPFCPVVVSFESSEQRGQDKTKPEDVARPRNQQRAVQASKETHAWKHKSHGRTPL